MAIETYRLEISENDAGTGIDADVYGDDDLVEASTSVGYEDHGLESGDEDASPIVREVTADVTTIDLQYQRDDAGFEFRVLGDREDVLVERVEDEEWGLE